MLNNLDFNLNLKWQQFYGGDAFYHLRGLKATQHGGCLMYATCYDENTQFEEYDVYVLKVDSSGILTSAGNYPSFRIQQLAIFPNPARDNITIRYPDLFCFDSKDIIIFNSLGKQVKRIPATQNASETKVDLTGLPAGLYFALLLVEGKKVATGKILVTR